MTIPIQKKTFKSIQMGLSCGYRTLVNSYDIVHLKNQNISRNENKLD